MKSSIFIIILLFSVCLLKGQEDENLPSDSLLLKGQISAWLHFNSSNELPIQLGGRYIPTIDYSMNLHNDRLIDLEASANIFGNAGLNFKDTLHFNGKIKPYRAWIRYSTEQFELRAGLQKINFGSASILRPLMWFDQIDARDPLQLTDGVWGLLVRYYFLNNTNFWFWSLYGNKNPKGWEQVKTNNKLPEFGGRAQFPFPKGEAGLSYHHRYADSRGMDSLIPAIARIPENRLGIDVRFDFVIGCWFEGSWIKKERNLGILTNQNLLNLGIDYTFGIGNGIYTALEQLIASFDERAFAYENTYTFSILSLMYPVSPFDNLSMIVYFNWKDSLLYNFIYWQKQYNRFSFYLMAYWNPDSYQIPIQSDIGNLYAGKGIQLMLVFDY